jgi:uncharacterized integral membrane protein
MRFLGWLIALPLLALLIVFALENGQSVTLGFWLFDMQIVLPLSLLALGLLLVGFGLGALTVSVQTLGLRFENRRLRRVADDLNAERALQPPSQPAVFPCPQRLSLFSRLKRKTT